VRGRFSSAVLLGALAFTGCRAPEPPTLAATLGRRGPAGEMARAYLAVALDGPLEERRRAALLWGLHACDVPSPPAALRAFSRAMPAGGLARLAARRLEEAMSSGLAAPAVWLEAAGATWVPREIGRAWRLRAAEQLLRSGELPGAAAALPPLDELAGSDRGRALAVLAATEDGAPAARRRLAIEHPDQFAAAFPAGDLAALERGFTSDEWRRRAEARLANGEAEEALRAARRAGTPAALTAARAALRLRRSREALTWAERAGRASVEGAVERAEALRQLAWAGNREQRREAFMRVAAAARTAQRLAAPASPEYRRADLLLAEASSELGRLTEAREAIDRSFESGHQRWEWVWRRLAFTSAQRRRPQDDPEPQIATSTRVRRTVAFWRAQAAAREREASLGALADYGLPDLPGLWAAAALGRHGVSVTLAEAAPVLPGPPAWAGDLLTAGRVADVVVAWRAELELAGVDDRAWLGLVALAAMRPLDAIPLLIRGEPRLLSGPWGGLPRPLLESYLPLPWRAEVEAAAGRSGVPPWLLAGLVRHESAWNPQARSSAGAVGLAQVLPATGVEKARSLGLGRLSRGDVIEPATNLLLGASLLRDWRADFAGSWTAGLAAYNGGARRARAVFELARSKDGPEFVEALEIPETWDYVHRVVLLAEGYRLLYWPSGGPYPWT